MSTEEKLYQAFGELLYIVAKADGVVQHEEKEELDQLVATHPWATQIQEAFNIALQTNSNTENLYQKVLNTCTEIGPHEAYDQMITYMKKIAMASDGLDSNEQKIITSFTIDLINRFSNEINLIKNK